MRARLLLLAPLATLALAACGEKSLDNDKGETFIRGVVSDKVGVKVKSVSCPEDVKAKKGGKFKCQVTGTDGTKGAVDVVQTDDKGNVEIRSTLLPSAKLEQSVNDVIRQQITGRPITSRCPDIVAPRKGSSFVCQVSGDDGTRGDARVTGKDDVGNVRIDADFLHTGAAENQIVRDVERKSGAASVEAICPAILPNMVGQQFDCDVTSKKGQITVVATQTAQGPFRLRLKR